MVRLFPHECGIPSQRVCRRGVENETVVPDEIEVMRKLTLGFVEADAEFFLHRAEIHGVLDDWRQSLTRTVVVVWRIALAYAHEKRLGVLGIVAQLREDALHRLLVLFALILPC